MAQKPSIPKGTRDFTPREMAKRNYIFDCIRDVYKIYGFREIETPAMENLSTLMGKYGEEGDKLLFRILNSGDALKGINRNDLEDMDPVHFANAVCDRGLRYDLTVPFARFVVQHKSELTFPFKRFQIQPVWRADRPQKGRYREFYQCDADVIGSESLLHEVELVQIIDEVFSRLQIRVVILLNNRKLLSAIATHFGIGEITSLTVAIDKFDKIGWDGVKCELKSKGISEETIDALEPIVTLNSSTSEKLLFLEELFGEANDIGKKGIEEMKYILEKLQHLGIRNEVRLDLSLARGLDYYTGTIFEVKSLDTQIGSITGGGRYDNLTGVFGENGMSGVGISFGADRIYDVLNELNLYPVNIASSSKVMFVNFGEKEAEVILPILSVLRKAGIASELYPSSVKLKKQMSYADDLSIPYVAFVGEEELREGTVTLKNMGSGEQKTFSINDIINLLGSL